MNQVTGEKKKKHMSLNSFYSNNGNIVILQFWNLCPSFLRCIEGESFIKWTPPNWHFLSTLTKQPNNGSTFFDKLSFLYSFFPSCFCCSKHSLKNNKDSGVTTPRWTKLSFIRILLFTVLYANNETLRGTTLF